MADAITIEVSVDSGRWDEGVAAMALRIADVTGDASVAAARAIQVIAQGKLTERGHSEFTWSPSPPGEPPASVSGALAASMTTIRSGEFSAMVGPTTRYGRIQELGGGMHGHPMMEFHKFSGNDIKTFRRAFVLLYARPYLEPSTEEAVDSGRVRDIYADFWSAAIEG